jgi:ElaB/YqjD/DUF883 family membrane-anchored ribosome-binding protein
MAGTSRIPSNFGNKPEGTTTAGGLAEEAKGKAQDVAATVTQKAQDLGHKIQDTASNVAHKAQDFASNVGHKAQEVASNVGQKAKDVASTAGDKTDDAIANVGEKMSSWAGSLRESAPQGGVVGSAATAVADRLDAGGHYLQQHGLGDMAEDLEGMIRRHPLPALCVCFGLGCLLGMAFSRR